MSHIIYVPIEPLPERYTESWYRNFPRVFREHGIEVTVIDGEALTDSVSVGTFLDINSTVYYKNSQMRKIAQMFHEGKVKRGDIFFFADVEFWGIESVRLMSQMNHVPVKIMGFLHAASYTKEDAFEVASPYQKYTELGWLMACDKIFVGSEYHKKAVIERRIAQLTTNYQDASAMKGRLIVTGNPLFEEDYKRFDVPKQNKVILPNRFDWEKRPNLSLDFAYLLKRKHPEVEIVVTTSRPTFRSNRKWLVELARNMERDGIITIHENLTKDEYHYHLATSKVMLTNSIEENFGYCIVESALYGTYPLMKRGLSHTELAQGIDAFLFDDEDEVVEKMEYLLGYGHTDNIPDPRKLAHRFYQVADEIAQQCIAE